MSAFPHDLLRPLCLKSKVIAIMSKTVCLLQIAPFFMDFSPLLHARKLKLSWALLWWHKSWKLYYHHHTMMPTAISAKASSSAPSWSRKQRLQLHIIWFKIGKKDFLKMKPLSTCLEQRAAEWTKFFRKH